MKMKLYYFAPSAPARSALITFRALGLDVDIVVVNLFEKEQLKADFLKINPQHCLPTIDDNGFILWESRAIAAYLASKYGKNDKLYPKEVQKRATIDRLLYFDAGTMYTNIRAIAFPVLFLGEKTISQDKRDNLNKGFTLLNGFLEGNKWAAGTENYTIADIALLASVTSIVYAGWNISEYPRVQKWLKDCEVIPGFAENKEGATVFGGAVKSKLNPGEI